MPTQRFLSRSGAVITDTVPLISSAGSGSSGAIPALNSSGLIDSTMLPTPTFQSLTDSSSVTANFASAILGNAKLTLNHSTSTRALNVSNLVNGGSYLVILKQDSTGGAACTLGTGPTTWYLNSGSGYASATSLPLTTSANHINVLAFTYDGTNCYATLG